MLNEVEEKFSALTSPDKMKFLRWAAESVGAKLDTVFGLTKEEVEDQAKTQAERLRIIAHEPNEILAAMPFVEIQAQADIPDFLKRKK